jgi:hypothetical protein
MSRLEKDTFNRSLWAVACKIQVIDELSPYFRIEEILGQRLTKKYLTRTVIRKIIHAFQRLLKKEFHLYNLAPEPAVRSYNDNNHEPRIFVVICKPIK